MTDARSEWMLYGAYGRTGRLILDEALRRGQRPAFGSEFALLVPGTRIREL